MENQHRKISGYRELTQQEIDLMNKIKAKGQDLLDVYRELEDYLSERTSELLAGGMPPTSVEVDEAARFLESEALKWARIGKTDVQTGVMAMVRAVAQPAGI